ncbi:Hint domain-containing protein [Maritimibacter sp. DP1N21-5]|uniref:Hint domain-containing protein n=1 Tax=Maritimibacter sp. DP1N21-5 TaxID=2836867 RepID=UPI001C493D2E|nr:Hint domain-containing protein [Maritimibacter sp. DP1N21-5]MBV7409476.1 Hint domain-containing protein [Maritimibacter sp. DP1N21-5]
MKDTDARGHLPVRHMSVYSAEDFRVSHGVNEGDALADATDLLPDDIYELGKNARPRRLGLAMSGEGTFFVSVDSEVGQPAAPVFLDSLVTFMSPDGETLETILLVEVDATTGVVDRVHLYPLSPIIHRMPYTLVSLDREGAGRKLAESASVNFTRGTRITMANGLQVPVEDLRPGDRVLTRDSGAQEVRWVGVQTVRAEGDFAPIHIAAGALNNEGPLVVSPNHRLFIYQRLDALGAGQRELLVKAGLLVNGTTVTRLDGGFVDYVQVLFDAHEIIYAEGIAAESLFLDTATRKAIPDEVTRRLQLSSDTAFPLGAVELLEGDFTRRADAVAMLKRVSAM